MKILKKRIEFLTKIILNIKFISILLTLLCYSCGVNRLYTSGSYGALKSYTEKPEYKGENEKALYVSGTIASGKHDQEENTFRDKKTIFSANIHRSHTSKFYNFYYGIGGAFGTYTFGRGLGDVISDDEKENFYNINAKTGFNFTLSRRKFDYRLIGVEFMYHNEFGAFQDKLDTLKEEYVDGRNGIVVVNKKSIFSWNLYSEIVYKINTKNALTLGMFFGSVPVNSNQMYVENGSLGGWLLGYRYDKFTLSYVYQGAKAADGLSSSKFGLTYRLD